MERQLLQWHPAFCAGVQIELAEAGADLTFIREYQLGRKPKQVDLLVIKKKGRRGYEKISEGYFADTIS